MKKIFCFGNEFLKQDSLAKELADELKIEGFKFIKCDSPNELLTTEGDIIIMDVVKSIKKVIVIKDINQLKINKIYSLHDFDLSFFLKLMKETGKIKSITIIGIHQEGNKEEIKEQIKALILKN